MLYSINWPNLIACSALLLEILVNVCIVIPCQPVYDVKKFEIKTLPWPTHGLLNTQRYMSHLKAKIKMPVFRKNSTKSKRGELDYVLFVFVYSAIFLAKRRYQITFRTILKKFQYKKY